MQATKYVRVAMTVRVTRTANNQNYTLNMESSPPPKRWADFSFEKLKSLWK